MTLSLLDSPVVRAPRVVRGLPVAVIGAGPVGLAAAAHLLERGLEVVVLEAGASAGSAMHAWGHVRLFSPWRSVVDAAAERLLAEQGWRAPDREALPTGRDVAEQYLAPLADAAPLRPRIRYGAAVTAVTRQGLDRTRTRGRAAAPFLLRLRTGSGDEELLAGAVIDASGTTTSPSPVTASGLPPLSAAGDRLVSGIPDVLGVDRRRFAGRRVAVVGSGHTAAHLLLALDELSRLEPGTEAVWVLRSADSDRLYGSAEDELTARASLGSAVRELVEKGRVRRIAGFAVSDVVHTSDGVRLVSSAGDIIEADIAVTATGFRPELGILRELRLALDDVVEAPVHLAPLIDPELHSCGTVPAHGAAELAHPEPGFYLAGMKSYGRAPTFLLLTGYEQVRSIAAELAGDDEAARRVELVLPETGGCSAKGPDSPCC